MSKLPPICQQPLQAQTNSAVEKDYGCPGTSAGADLLWSDPPGWGLGCSEAWIAAPQEGGGPHAGRKKLWTHSWNFYTGDETLCNTSFKDGAIPSIFSFIFVFFI